MTPEEKQEKRRANQRRYNAKWHDENRDKVNAAERARRANRTPEQREAERAYRARYREQNREKINARNRRHYEGNPELWILGNIRMRARQAGLPCDITVDDIRPPEFCPVLGLRLERNAKGREAGPQPNSPSVDRIIPELGYVKGNVIVVSHLANCIKQNATPEQIMRVAQFYLALQDKKRALDLAELREKE